MYKPPYIIKHFQVSAVSRSLYDSESDDDKPQSVFNHKNITNKGENEFGGTLGIFILVLLLPILVILAQIGLKAVMK